MENKWCNEYSLYEDPAINYLVPKAKTGRIIKDTTVFLLNCVECKELTTGKCRPQTRQEIIRALDSNKK